jgi:hypothetical protein
MATSSFLRRLEARMVLGFEELASEANTCIPRYCRQEMATSIAEHEGLICR